MKLRLATTLVLVVGLAVAAVSVSATTTSRALGQGGPTGTTLADRRPRHAPRLPPTTSSSSGTSSCSSAIRAYPAETGPTVTARALGVLHTATYDAWAAYDPVAKGTRLGEPAAAPAGRAHPGQQEQGDQLRGLPGADRPVPRHAAREHRLGRPPRPDDRAWATTPTTPPPTGTKPAGVGNLAAQAVLDYRHDDGSNQLGDDPAAPPSDATRHHRHQPVNPWNQCHTTRWRWQPLCALTLRRRRRAHRTCPRPGLPNYASRRPPPRSGATVTMFGPLAPSQFRVTGPPKNPDGSYSTVDIDRRSTTPPTSPTPRRSRPSTGPTGRHRSSRPATRRCSPRPSPARTQLQPGHRRQDVLRARQRGDGRRHRRLVPEVQVRLRAADHRHPLPLRRTSMVNSWLGPQQGLRHGPGRRTGCPTRRSTWSPRRSPSTCPATPPSPRPGRPSWPRSPAATPSAPRHHPRRTPRSSSRAPRPRT